MAETPEAPEQEIQDTPTPDTEPEAPDTPETPAAEDTEPEVDYQKRYEDLRPEFDRTNQILASLQGRHGVEAQQEAARLFGFEFADEEPEEEGLTSPEDEIAEIKRQLAERDEQAEQQQYAAAEKDWIQQELGKVEKDFDRKLSAEERDIVESFAVAHRFEDGQPDIEGGKERLKAIYSHHQKQLIDSKRAPKPPAGVAGAEAIDTSTPEGRRKAIADIAEASFASD